MFAMFALNYQGWRAMVKAGKSLLGSISTRLI